MLLISTRALPLHYKSQSHLFVWNPIENNSNMLFKPSGPSYIKFVQIDGLWSETSLDSKAPRQSLHTASNFPPVIDLRCRTRARWGRRTRREEPTAANPLTLRELTFRDFLWMGWVFDTPRALRLILFPSPSL
jgi:hypothetical protein